MPFLYINTPAKVNILRNFGKIMHLSLDFFGKGCIIIISSAALIMCGGLVKNFSEVL
jgi:hypothetical protein